MTTAERELPSGERLARLETRAEHIEQEVLQLRQDLRQEVLQLREDLRQAVAKTDRNFFWTLGVILAMWVTVVSSILVRT